MSHPIGPELEEINARTKRVLRAYQRHARDIDKEVVVVIVLDKESNAVSQYGFTDLGDEAEKIKEMMP